MISPTRLAGSVIKVGVTAAGAGIKAAQSALRLVTGSGRTDPVDSVDGVESVDEAGRAAGESAPPSGRSAPADAPEVAGLPDADEVRERARAAALAELARPQETVEDVDPFELVEAVVSEPVEDQLVYSTDTGSGSEAKTSASSGGASGP